MDRKTKKQLQTQADVCIYLPRGRGHRSLISSEDRYRVEATGVANYMHNTAKQLFVAVKNEGLPIKKNSETSKQLLKD